MGYFSEIYVVEKRLINPNRYREVSDIEGLTVGWLNVLAVVPEGEEYAPEEIDFVIGHDESLIETFHTRQTFDFLYLLETEFGYAPEDFERNYGILNIKAFKFLADVLLKDETFEDSLKDQFRETLKLTFTNEQCFLIQYY